MDLNRRFSGYGTFSAWNRGAFVLGTGANNTSWTVVSTATGKGVLIDAAATLKPAIVAAQPNNFVSDVLIPGASDTEPGKLAVTISATTPAVGLTPESQQIYLLVYDNSTGSLLHKIVLGPLDTAADGQHLHDGIPQLLSATATSIVAQQDRPDDTVLEEISPDTGAIGTTKAFGPSTSVDDQSGGELALMTGGNCTQAVIVAAETLATTSMSPCQNQSQLSVGFLGSASYAIGSEDCNQCGATIYSVATSQPALVPAQIQSNKEVPCSGPRSDIVAFYPNEYFGASDGYFLNSTNWSVVYDVKSADQLNFSCKGVADDDVWANTTSGHLIVDKTGKQIAGDWTYSPIAGDTNWTVFGNGPDSGQLYLLRYTGTAFSALPSAPFSGASGTPVIGSSG